MRSEISAPDMGAEVCAKRLATNRQNAAKSTGPKSAVGKLTVSRNGIEHGIYAVCPVIEEVESLLDWKRYRKAMLANLEPVGMVEITLAERITLAGWRQRRVVRFETEQVRQSQEEALDHVGNRLGVYNHENEPAALRAQEIVELAKWNEQRWQGLQMLLSPDQDQVLSESQAASLLFAAYTDLGLKEGFEKYLTQLVVPEPLTCAVVLQLMRQLVECHSKSFDGFLERVAGRLGEEYGQTSLEAKKVDAAIVEHRRDNLVPDDRTLERVMRYEAHLSRQFHKDLHELQRLQAMRHGLPVGMPVAIDVDVTTGAHA